MFDKEDAEILRSVLDGLNVGVYIVDRECRISFWNETLEKMTGYPRGDVLGRRSTEDVLHHCVLDSDKSEEYSVLRAAMEDGEVRHETANVQHKDGHRISASIFAAAVRNAHGNIIGAVESLSYILPTHPTAGPRDMSRSAVKPLGEVKRQEQISRCLTEICIQAQQEQVRFGLIKVHIDQLATLQKTHGMEAATKLRELVVQTLGDALSTADEVGIWSDSEFLIITFDQTSRGLELDAGRLRSLLERLTFRWWGDALPISVSIGGVMAEPLDTPVGLLAGASEALQQSMQRDGNQITILDRWTDGEELACSQSSE